MLALGIVLLTVGGASDYLIVTVWYWHALVAYAHTGHLLGLQQTTQAPGLAANESYSA